LVCLISFVVPMDHSNTILIFCSLSAVHSISHSSSRKNPPTGRSQRKSGTVLTIRIHAYRDRSDRGQQRQPSGRFGQSTNPGPPHRGEPNGEEQSRLGRYYLFSGCTTELPTTLSIAAAAFFLCTSDERAKWAASSSAVTACTSTTKRQRQGAT
jgi:hypothetical protein